MLPAKIKLTEQVVSKIKAARIEKRIPAAILSRAIKRDDSYISSLEAMRLRTISAADLTGIISFLFNIPAQIAAEKAEEYVNAENKATNHSDWNMHDSLPYDTSSGAMSVSEPMTNGYLSDMKTNYAQPELISDMLETMTELIIEFYGRDPKEAVYALSSFIKSMQFDPVFTMNVLGLPVFMLKTISIDKRKETFADILSVFKKYAAES